MASPMASFPTFPSGLPSMAALAVDVAVRLGVTEWVIAPGSRSAPLTAALAARDDVQRRVVYDERSAAYIALGMAQQLHRPVGLVCTSGTAALNFGPAVAEAFYQGVPLLVLTADRPPEWIGQEDNQAIQQRHLYGPHAKAAFDFPLDDGHRDTRRHAARIVSDALQVAASLPQGPVHINVPLREPLYTPLPEPIEPLQTLAAAAPTVPLLAEAAWDDLLAEWRSAERKLIVCGLLSPDAERVDAVRALAVDPSVAVIGDITSNMLPAASPLTRWEPALGSALVDAANPARLDAFIPDLVLVLGGPLTSRYLKTLLRIRPPRALWRVAPGLPAPDPFQGLTRALPVEPTFFLRALAARAGVRPAPRCDYANTWRAAQRPFEQTLETFLASQPFGEFAAVAHLLHALPPDSHLQIGNSMPIRYANLLGLPHDVPVQVFSNRGTSGIDGTVSTAVGAALACPDVLTTLLVGDLAFFYDRNGLWHPNLPPNLRIVLLNNHGGGIFDLIEGPNRLDASVRRDYFLTPQPLTARRTADDFGLAYFQAESEHILRDLLPAFLSPQARPALLEVETDMAVNSAVFAVFRTWMAQAAMPQAAEAAGPRNDTRNAP